MADLNRSGMVRSADQKRDERRRKGWCETCDYEPVLCYEIKKTWGGMKNEKVPLTIPGRVFQGICLKCNRDKDPDGGRHRRHSSLKLHQHHSSSQTRRHPHQQQQTQDRRASRQLPHAMDREGIHDENRRANSYDENRRTNSVPNMGLERGPVRQAGFRDLAKSMHRSRDHVQSLPTDYMEHQDSMDHLQLADGYDQEQEPAEQASEQEQYEEVIEYNIFNEPVRVMKKLSSSRSRKNVNNAPSSPTRNSNGRASSPRNSPHRQSHPRAEEKVGEQAPEHLNVPNLSQQSPPLQTGRNIGNHHSPPRRQNSDHHRHSPLHQQNSGHHPSPPDRAHQMEEQKQPSLPSLFKNINNNATNQSEPSGEDEPLDALAQLIAQYRETHPEETVKFVPGSQTILPGGGELVLPPGGYMEDDFSVMTPDTCFGRGSIASTVMSRRQPSRRTNLTAISETSSGASSGQQRSMISHKIKEPVVPVQVTQPAGNNNEAPAQNMESYLESSAPDLLTLREFVESFTAAGADAEAIDTVTLSLIHDNATSMSMDLALFCLTTLWVLARKSDENKRKIIFEDSTFDAIIEAMQIYRERSAEIQTRACGVLWSLSMDPNDRKHVAQGGGCDAILNAMLVHMDDDALQVMALGALKVLSFDNIGKSTLRSRGTLSIVADIMQKHLRNPTIQSEGCVILGNLAVDNANHFVAPVTEKEVDAVIRGILAHPDSLEVHEAACFTLMSLASSAVNVELIRMNAMTRVSLELACQKHPEDVGNNIFTLLRRLKFDAPAPLLPPMTEQR